MGFRPKPRTYTLTFADDELTGLEINARGVSAADYLAFSEMASGLSDKPSTSEETAAAVKATDTIFRLLGSKLISWNVEDDHGNPVPASYEGLKSQDVMFVQQVVTSWMQAIGGVTPPLQNGSNSGGTFQAEMLEMAELSRSLENLSGQS